MDPVIAHEIRAGWSDDPHPEVAAAQLSELFQHRVELDVKAAEALICAIGMDVGVEIQRRFRAVPVLYEQLQMIVFYRIAGIIDRPHNELLPLLDFASSLACQVLGRSLPIVESAIAVDLEGADDEVDQGIFRLAQMVAWFFPAIGQNGIGNTFRATLSVAVARGAIS